VVAFAACLATAYCRASDGGGYLREGKLNRRVFVLTTAGGCGSNPRSMIWIRRLSALAVEQRAPHHLRRESQVVMPSE